MEHNKESFIMEPSLTSVKEDECSNGSLSRYNSSASTFVSLIRSISGLGQANRTGVAPDHTTNNSNNVPPSPTPPPPQRSLQREGENKKSFVKSFIAGSFKRKTSTNAGASGKKKRMLTFEQLSDLFRRLDRDGNGELDLEEFLQISSKLKLNASEDYISRDVATNKSGTLNMQSFVSAYQIIFTKSSEVAASPSKQSTLRRKLSSPTEAVTALRYGMDPAGELIFELFLGTAVELLDGPMVSFSEKRIYDLSVFTGDVGDQEYSIEPGFKASLTEINERIIRDSMQNKLTRCKLFWWIDIAMLKVASYRVDKYIAALGLPNDSKFRANFNQFGSCLPKDEKNHIYTGNGTCRLGSVSSLSLFVQSISLQRIPLAYHIPVWLKTLMKTFLPVSAKESLTRYYSTRLAFFFAGSSQVNPAVEYKNLYESACNISKRLDDDADELDSDFMCLNELDEHEARHLETHLFRQAPLPNRPSPPSSTPPSWLMSGTEIKKHPANIMFSTLGIHLMNYGHDVAGCCLTIREIDSERTHEKQSGSDLLLKTAADPEAAKIMIRNFAKKGIIGRLVTGIRIKMLQNACNDGVATVAGNLNDGPASLASVLITLVQSFSMNTLGTLSMWLNTISSEVDELAVSKHTSQAKELWRVLSVIKDYVGPTDTIITHLFDQAIQHRSEQAAKQEEAEMEAALMIEKEEEEKKSRERDMVGEHATHHGHTGTTRTPRGSSDDGCNYNKDPDFGLDHDRESLDSSSDSSASEDPSSPRTSFTNTRKSSVMPPSAYAAKRNMGTILMKRRTTNMANGDAENSIQLSFAILPHGSHNLPMSVELLEPFFGENINSTCQNLEMIMEGDESLEVQGTRYWREQLGQLEMAVVKVKEDITVSLDEKRNFFSFILTVVTVFLAPLTILTGYWGMNFDNMVELDSQTYEILPGVKLLWFVGTCVYFLFLALSIHFRVLYSAT